MRSIDTLTTMSAGGLGGRGAAHSSTEGSGTSFGASLQDALKHGLGNKTGGLQNTGTNTVDVEDNAPNDANSRVGAGSPDSSPESAQGLPAGTVAVSISDFWAAVMQPADPALPAITVPATPDGVVAGAEEGLDGTGVGAEAGTLGSEADSSASIAFGGTAPGAAATAPATAGATAPERLASGHAGEAAAGGGQQNPQQSHGPVSPEGAKTPVSITPLAQGADTALSPAGSASASAANAMAETGSTPTLATEAGSPALSLGNLASQRVIPVAEQAVGGPEAPTIPALSAVAVTPPQAPVQASAAAPVAAHGHTPAPALVEQLARPLFTLAGAPLGEHVMKISVVPDALGPVTVRAQLSADGIHIELIAASEAGREGLRGILSDLRRDLATGGMASSLSLGSGNSPANQGEQRNSQTVTSPWSNSMALKTDQDPNPHGPMPPAPAGAINNSLDITV
ncbi:flagellar hook-length control protein FliK [Arthrobacter sp. TMP15]|uniref:flagellar hook-length control protein FliK n=1 Tax=Arthrobacter sp. TMP15 TaxID=3140789 RepID=UPI0031BBA7A7